MEINVQATAELLETMQEKKIIIYGAGNIAARFYAVLSRTGIEQNVHAFAVTKPGEERSFCGKKVISVDEIPVNPGYMVCVAVHESIKDDLFHELKIRKITNCVWVYPHLFRMFIGTPVQENVFVPVDDIVRNCFDYRIAVRYLAIEQYYGKNTFGYDLYVRAMALSCDQTTAEKRLTQFQNLIHSWEISGYQQKKKICLDEGNAILDGAHRVTLAKYHGMESVCCDIFRRAPDFRVWMGSETLMEKKTLRNGAFTSDELETIEHTYLRLRGETNG